MPNVELVIEDGKIYAKEYKLSYGMPLADFAKQIYKKEEQYETPLLPANCCKYVFKNNKNIYYIHIPRDFYEVTYCRRNDVPKTYTVYFPDMIFTFNGVKNPNSISFSDIRIWWNNKPKLDLNDMRIPPLHNIYDNGSVCIGDVMNKNTTQVEYIESYIQTFFENKFNNDLNGGRLHLPEVSKIQQTIHENKELSAEQKEERLIQTWWNGSREQPIVQELFLEVHKVV